MEKFDIVIIIPLKEEFEQFQHLFPIKKQYKIDGVYYYSLDVPFSEYKLIAVLLPDIGTAPAGNITVKLLTEFEIKLIVVIGIAGALDNDLNIGDIVIASEIYDYQAASKAIDNGDTFSIQRSGKHWPLGFTIRTFIQNLEFSPGSRDIYLSWEKKIQALKKKMKLNRKQFKLVKSRPKISIGHIASGNIVNTSKQFTSELKKVDRKLLAIEMEAAGVAEAVHNSESSTKLLIIRGISDFADNRKKFLDSQGNGNWRKFAMFNASSLLLEIVLSEAFHEIIKPDSIYFIDSLEEILGSRNYFVKFKDVFKLITKKYEITFSKKISNNSSKPINIMLTPIEKKKGEFNHYCMHFESMLNSKIVDELKYFIELNNNLIVLLAYEIANIQTIQKAESIENLHLFNIRDDCFEDLLKHWRLIE